MAITHAITKFDPIVAVIRSHLLSDDRFLAWDKWQGGNPEVYPRYITFAENADFPCITICLQSCLCYGQHKRGIACGHTTLSCQKKSQGWYLAKCQIRR